MRTSHPCFPLGMNDRTISIAYDAHVPFRIPTDGLYVLLRSPMSELAPVPPGHEGKLMTDSDLASLPSCPWSLSGPQYPKHDGQKVQQRYCYPRGNPGYSNGKGGAMWTMVSLGLKLVYFHCCSCANLIEKFCLLGGPGTRGYRL